MLLSAWVHLDFSSRAPIGRSIKNTINPCKAHLAAPISQAQDTCSSDGSTKSWRKAQILKQQGKSWKILGGIGASATLWSTSAVAMTAKCGCSPFLSSNSFPTYKSENGVWLEFQNVLVEDSQSTDVNLFIERTQIRHRPIHQEVHEV